VGYQIYFQKYNQHCFVIQTQSLNLAKLPREREHGHTKLPYDIKSQPNRDPPPQTRNNISRYKNTISQSSPITESFNQQDLHGTMFEKDLQAQPKAGI